MPTLRITNSIIEKACELRQYGGSDGACARHAGVTPSTFYRWLHFGQALRDYLDNGSEFEDPDVYRNWKGEASVVIEKLKRELAETKGKLSKEHRAYLKLWDELVLATDIVVTQCQQTIDKATNIDPEWALKVLHWFHPDEYQDAPTRAEISGPEGGAITLRVVYDDKDSNA